MFEGQLPEDVVESFGRKFNLSERAKARLIDQFNQQLQPNDQTPFKVHCRDIDTLVTNVRTKLRALVREGQDMGVPLRNIYRMFDKNNNGTLSRSELISMIDKLNLSTTQVNVDALIRRFDKNRNGIIEFEEFKNFIISRERYSKTF